jgi:hypothetical protein
MAFILFRMEYGRKVGNAISFSSSDESGEFPLEPYKDCILQDPQIKIEMPVFVVSEKFEAIMGNNSKAWEINLISLRRGLLLLKVLAQLNDPGNLEWISVLKIIKTAVESLKENSIGKEVSSTARWANITQYATRSRRFVTWIKVMKSLNVLTGEFPYILDHARKLHAQIKDLLTGQTRLSIQNRTLWDEELRKTPKEKYY